MKKIGHVVLLHGYAETPDRAWFPWLHRRLEESGMRVWSPALPAPLRPDFRKWIKAVAGRARTWTPETVVIGHSLGAVLALRLLQTTVKERVRAVILAGAPFASTLNIKALTQFFEHPVDWHRVRDMAETFVVIHAKNDPLVPFDHALRYREALGAELVLAEAGGHYTGKTAPIIAKAVKALQ